MSPAGSSRTECLYVKKRDLVRRAMPFNHTSLKKMAARYERERKDGKRLGDHYWRSVVRWEVDRAKREEA